MVPGNLGPSSLVGINGQGERINGLKWNESTPYMLTSDFILLVPPLFRPAC